MLYPTHSFSDSHTWASSDNSITPMTNPTVTAQPLVRGYGKSFASFGEIVQGRLSNGEDFLVTLPVNLWSTCTLECETLAGDSLIQSEFAKSKAVAEQLLTALGLETGWHIRLQLQSEIPIGKGLSSSTADMLAVVRAFQDTFGVMISESFISRLFTQIEPHDGLHYASSVAYNHRQGKLLQAFHYIPDFQIVAVDVGGELSTLEYNKKLCFSPHWLQAYDALYQQLATAFAQRDDAAIARCATQSARLHVERTGNAFLAAVLQRAAQLEVMGVLATHSGTCAGFMLAGQAQAAQLEVIRQAVSDLGHVFNTRTLKILS